MLPFKYSILGLLLLLTNSSCNVLHSYMKEQHPMWVNNQQVINHSSSTPLKVVSFNIEFSRAIKEAILELKTQPELVGADVFFLQEMDETGVQEIAQALNYNYLYFPFTYDKKTKQDFGNAILSKFPLEQPIKIILPHAKKTNKRKRMVTQALVSVNEEKILLASIHLATILLLRKKRLAQVQNMTNTIDDYLKKHQITYAIIGGDFNTLLKNYRKKVITEMEEINFDWATKEVGPTGKELYGLLRPINDHFFTKGFDLVDAGKFKETIASNHYPIWVSVTFKQ